MQNFGYIRFLGCMRAPRRPTAQLGLNASLRSPLPSADGGGRNRGSPADDSEGYLQVVLVMPVGALVPATTPAGGGWPWSVRRDALFVEAAPAVFLTSMRGR